MSTSQVKAINNVIQLKPYNQKLSQDDIYNKCHDKWTDIKRACNPTKVIVAEAILYIAAIEFLFLKNSQEVIFDSDLLLKKFDKGPKQRSRYLKQLSDLYNIKYHSKYIYNNKTYRCVFSCTRTINCIEILSDPRAFYGDQNQDKSDHLTSQKCPVHRTNLSSTYIDIDEYREELEELSIRAHSNSQEEYARANDTSKDLPCLPCGAASLSPVLSVVEASKHCDELSSKSHFTNVLPSKERVPHTDPISLMSADQEREHYKNHRNRQESSGEQTLRKTKLSLLPKLNSKANEVTNAHQEETDFQLRVENSKTCDTLEHSIDTKVKVKSEEKPHDLDEEFRQALAHKAERTSVWQGCLRRVAENMGKTYDPLSGKMREVTFEDIRCQFSNMSYKVDLKAKCIRLQAKGDLWIPAFELTYSEKFKEAAYCIGYSFEVVRTLEEKQ